MTHRTAISTCLATFIALGITLSSANSFAQFSHQVPLRIPAGSYGVQPNLGLAYTPGLPNGLLGVGWQLTGLSSISRVSFGEGIRYEGSDTYAHSQFGILIRQPDGSYRSKQESFTKLVPLGACGDGPCSWRAYERTGRSIFFGASEDSRVLKGGSDSVRQWHVTKVEDRFGNFYDVSYSNAASDGAIYPRRLTYTKGPELTRFRTIDFEYENRLDIETSYAESDHSTYTQRLKWISIKSDENLIRKYRLDYDEYGSTTARSHLTRIQEYGSDGASTMPPQVFTWQQGGAGFEAQGWARKQGGWIRGADWQKAATYLSGDFNGDGKSDIAYVFNDDERISIDVHESNGHSFSLARWGTNLGAWQRTDEWKKVGQFLTGDFTGDGKTDIAFVFNNHNKVDIDIYESTGNSFQSHRWTTRSTNWRCGDEWQTCATFLTGDFNGDGRSDIAYSYNEDEQISIDMYASTGSEFSYSTWASRQGRWQRGAEWSLAALFLNNDFDGDGKDDIAYIFNDGGLISIDVHRSLERVEKVMSQPGDATLSQS